MLWSESLLHTVCPLLQASLKTLSTEASTSVLPATFRRRRPLIHWVVCSLAGGHLVGAVTSCIRSVTAGKLTSWIVHVCMWYICRTHLFTAHDIACAVCVCVCVCACVCVCVCVCVCIQYVVVYCMYTHLVHRAFLLLLQYRNVHSV